MSYYNPPPTQGKGLRLKLPDRISLSLLFFLNFQYRTALPRIASGVILVLKLLSGEVVGSVSLSYLWQASDWGRYQQTLLRILYLKLELIGRKVMGKYWSCKSTNYYQFSNWVYWISFWFCSIDQIIWSWVILILWCDDVSYLYTFRISQFCKFVLHLNALH